jgi:hypothetical protein
MKNPLLLLATLLLVTGCATSSEYESAAFKVLHKSDKFEIREYESLKMAETMIGKEGKARNAGFMRLYRYITGANAQQEEIAMTIPVFMSRGEEEAMSFVLPENLIDAPKANDPRVVIAEKTLGHVAALRFSGRAKEAQCAEKEAELRSWIKTLGLSAGESWLAVYNEPWIPGPMRHNEILVRLSDPPASFADFAK